MDDARTVTLAVIVAAELIPPTSVGESIFILTIFEVASSKKITKTLNQSILCCAQIFLQNEEETDKARRGYSGRL